MKRLSWLSIVLVSMLVLSSCGTNTKDTELPVNPEMIYLDSTVTDTVIANTVVDTTGIKK